MKRLVVKSQQFFFKDTVSSEKITEWVNFQLITDIDVIFEVTEPRSANAELLEDGSIHICGDNDYIVCTIETIDPESATFFNSQ